MILFFISLVALVVAIFRLFKRQRNSKHHIFIADEAIVYDKCCEDIAMDLMNFMKNYNGGNKKW